VAPDLESVGALIRLRSSVIRGRPVVPTLVSVALAVGLLAEQESTTFNSLNVIY
jgi:hypothetical protein